MPSVSVVLMGRCRSDSEADECEWIMQRNVTASMRKSSMCVREGMLVVGGMLSLRPMGCSKAQGR